VIRHLAGDPALFPPIAAGMLGAVMTIVSMATLGAPSRYVLG